MAKKRLKMFDTKIKAEKSTLEIPRVNRPAYKWDTEVKKLAEEVAKIIEANEQENGGAQKQIPATGY